MKSQKLILLTGFEPFGGESINPSQCIVEALDGKRIDGHRIVGRVLPVAFTPCKRLVAEWIDELNPTLVIGLGQAGGRAELSLERIAINLIDARICDNEGNQPIDAPVLAGAGAGLFSSLPLKRILLALRDAGIPVAISHSAGTYVCNQVFFLTAARLANSVNQSRGGFIHVLPTTPTLRWRPALRIDVWSLGTISRWTFSRLTCHSKHRSYWPCHRA